MVRAALKTMRLVRLLAMFAFLLGAVSARAQDVTYPMKPEEPAAQTPAVKPVVKKPAAPKPATRRSENRNG